MVALASQLLAPRWSEVLIGSLVIVVMLTWKFLPSTVDAIGLPDMPQGTWPAIAIAVLTVALIAYSPTAGTARLYRVGSGHITEMSQGGHRLDGVGEVVH